MYIFRKKRTIRNIILFASILGSLIPITYFILPNAYATVSYCYYDPQNARYMSNYAGTCQTQQTMNLTQIKVQIQSEYYDLHTISFVSFNQFIKDSLQDKMIHTVAHDVIGKPMTQPYWFDTVMIWWINGDISDKDFYKSLQYMLDKYIIHTYSCPVANCPG